MKKRLSIFIVMSMVFSSLMLKAQGENSNGIYKSVDEEVGLEVFRGTGEVKLLIQVKDISQYHHIVVERSAETPNYFGKCKYISSEGVKLTDGKISEADRYPYSAAKNVYYRIKTVTNDGVERAYPAVLLPAITQ